MSALLDRCSADIPGLCLVWSPLFIGMPATGRIARGALRSVDPMSDGRYRVWAENDFAGALGALPADLWLDLTDPTGRAHAAWWLMDRWRSGPRLPVEDRRLVIEVCRFAEQGADMTPTQIDTLARLVLRLAGRTP